MLVFENKFRVRYADTDQMGYMYYGNYATYYEVARTEMLRSTGISYKELEGMGVMLPVTELQSKYLQAAKYDDLITVKTIIRERPSVRIRFEYEMHNEAGTLLNKGETILVFVDMKTGRPCRPPAAFEEKMNDYFD